LAFTFSGDEVSGVALGANETIDTGAVFNDVNAFVVGKSESCGT